MSTTRERLVLDLDFDDNNGEAKIRRFQRTTDKMSESVYGLDKAVKRNTRTQKSWLSVLRDVSVIGASFRYFMPDLINMTWGWNDAIASTNAELERSTVIMSNFSEGATRMERMENAKAQVDGLLQKAKQLPFEFNTLQDSLVKLNTGVGKDANLLFKGLTESVSQFGGSSEMLKRASVAILQMGGKGVISMEELRQQLGEAVPNAAKLAARSLSMTYAEFVKLVSEGKVAAQSAMKEMAREMIIDAEGSADALMTTYDGLKSRIKTQFTILMKELNEAGYFDTLKSEMREFLEFLESSEAKEWARTFGQFLEGVIKLMSTLTQTAYEYGEVIKTVFMLYAGKKVFNVMTSGIKSVGSGYQSATQKIKRQIVAVRRLAAAKKAMSQTTIKDQAIINRHMAAASKGYRAHMVAIGAMKTKTQALTRAQRAHVEQLAQGAAVIERQRRATQKMAVAKRALGGAMRMFGGIMGGIAISGIIMYIEKMITANKETERLLKTLRNPDALIGMDEIERAREQLEEEKINLEKARQALDTFENGVTQGYDTDGSHREMLEQNITNAEQAIKELEYRIDTNLNSAIERSAESVSGRIVDNFKSNTDKVRSGFAEALEELNKLYNAPGSEITQDEFFGASQAIKIERQASLMELFTKRVKTFKKEYDAGRSDLNEEEYEAVLKALNDELERMGDERERLQNMDEPVDPTLNTLSNYMSKVEGKVSTVRGHIDELQVKMENATPFQAYVNSLPESVRENDRMKESLEELEKIFAEMANTEKLYKTQRGLEKTGDLIGTLGVKYDRLGLKAEDTLSNLDNDFFSNKNLKSFEADLGKINDRLEKAGLKSQLVASNLSGSFAGVAAETDALGLSLVDMGVSLQDLIDMQEQAYSADFANSIELITDKNKKLQKQINNVGRETGERYTREIGMIDQAIARVKEEARVKGFLSTQQERIITGLQKTKTLYTDLAKAQKMEQNELHQMINSWKDFEKNIKSVQVNGLESFADSMANMLTGSSGSWDDWAKGVLKSLNKVIAKMILMKYVIQPMMNAFGWGAGGGGQISGGVQSQASNMNFDMPAIPNKFAKGGIMTDHGRAPLNAYANGGIANSPQLALFGEGRMPEAYVPLPDGRTIPVTVTNSEQAASKRPVGQDVQVNVYNEGNEKKAESRSRLDGEKMIIDVFLKNASKPGPVRETIRGIK